MGQRRLAAELLTKLETYDTPTICNALEVLDVERCGFGFTRQVLICSHPDRPARVGYARTARIRTTRPQGLSAAERAAEADAYLEYVSAGEGPKIALHQDLDGTMGIAACWGDVMATMHRAMGFVGVVTNGAIRDIAGMPDGIMMLATGEKPSHGLLHTIDHAGPVDIAGMLANDDDLVHMDRNGAVAIPHDLAADLPAAADQVLAHEERIKAISNAEPFDIAALRAGRARH